MHGGAAAAEVVNLRKRPVARGLHGLIHKLGYPLALGGGNGHDGHAEELAHQRNVYTAAVRVDLVHHVQRKHRRNAQLQKLQGEIEVALNIRGVYYIYYPVRLLVYYEVARDYLLLRIRAQGVYAGQIDH